MNKVVIFKALAGMTITLLVILLVSCQADEVDVKPTVEHLAALTVSATQGALPNEGLYSTATPYATFTAVPTYTTFPTSTNYPTHTPFPTTTSYPTFTPEPTATTTATPLPQPTAATTAANTQQDNNFSGSLDIQILQLALDHRAKLNDLGGNFSSAINNGNQLDCQNLVFTFDTYIGAVVPEYDVSGLAANYQTLFTAVKEAQQVTSEGSDISEIVRQCREQVANGNVLVEFDNGFLRRADADLLEPRGKLSGGIKAVGGE